MDIEDVNNFLIEQTTGLTKEQVKSDIETIQARREEVIALEAKTVTLTESVQLEEDKQTTLLAKNKEIQTKQENLAREIEKVEGRYKRMVAELPVLNANVEAHRVLLEDYDKQVKALDTRFTKAQALELKLAKEKLEITEATLKNEEQERANTLATIKVEKALKENTALVDIIFIRENRESRRVKLIG